MKYYISDYWKMMNSDNPDVREEGEKVWVETAKKYGPYFEAIKSKLPKGFVTIFYKHGWFHNFSINRMNLLNTGRYTPIVESQISHNDTVYKITFTGVSRFLVNIPTTQNWLCGVLTWGYTEFELNDDNSWIIRILCDFFWVTNS